MPLQARELIPKKNEYTFKEGNSASIVLPSFRKRVYSETKEFAPMASGFTLFAQACLSSVFYCIWSESTLFALVCLLQFLKCLSVLLTIWGTFNSLKTGDP